METCAEIFNKYVDWCFSTKSYNNNKAHKELYAKFRVAYPTVPSATIQSIRAYDGGTAALVLKNYKLSLLFERKKKNEQKFRRVHG